MTAKLAAVGGGRGNGGRVTTVAKQVAKSAPAGSVNSMAISYSAIFAIFKDDLSAFSRGEQRLNSGDVVQFSKHDQQHYTVKIRGSLKKQEFTVQVHHAKASIYARPTALNRAKRTIM